MDADLFGNPLAQPVVAPPADVFLVEIFGDYAVVRSVAQAVQRAWEQEGGDYYDYGSKRIGFSGRDYFGLVDAQAVCSLQASLGNEQYIELSQASTAIIRTPIFDDVKEALEDMDFCPSGAGHLAFVIVLYAIMVDLENQFAHEEAPEDL